MRSEAGSLGFPQPSEGPSAVPDCFEHIWGCWTILREKGNEDINVHRVWRGSLSLPHVEVNASGEVATGIKRGN